MTECNAPEDKVTFAEILDSIRAILDTPDDELSDEQKRTHMECIQLLGELEEDKVDALGFFIKEATARADFLKEESRRLSGKARSIENRIAGIKDHYAYMMYENGLKKIAGKQYTLSYRNTPSVVITNDKEIPEEFLRVIPEVREPDKVAIKAAIKAGRQVPGTVLVDSASLQIR